MSEHMKKRPTKQSKDIVQIYHEGAVYQFPKKIAEKYRISEPLIDAATIFADLNEKYTRPGALLRGIRIREQLTQTEMAKRIKVTQSDISQMEKGIRTIGRMIAKRIEKLFGVNYRSLME